MKLQDKVVIITGGAGGIGAGMGRAMAKEGAIIVAVDLNAETGAKTAAELQQISPKSSFIQADLTDHKNLKNVVEEVVSKYGRLDVLVNNAHASKQVPFLETTPEDLALSMDTGFYPTWYLMQAAIPHLKKTFARFGLHGFEICSLKRFSRGTSFGNPPSFQRRILSL